ncbi:MAG: YbjN domain-containing protein [Bdellovibrionales bacterium]
MSFTFNSQLDFHESETNPLDCIEDILAAHDWRYKRASHTELTLTLKGQHSGYRMFFIWQHDMSALLICIQYDLQIAPAHFAEAAKTLMDINTETWMGHFDLPADTATPGYRYTMIIPDPQNPAQSMIEKAIDIALTHCERFYPAFHLLAETEKPCRETLPLALMETMGNS